MCTCINSPECLYTGEAAQSQWHHLQVRQVCHRIQKVNHVVVKVDIL